MYATNDFLNRTVLTVSDGQIRGKVVNFEFDGKLKNLTHLIVGKPDSVYCAVPVNKIFKKENDALVFMNGEDFLPLDKAPLNPVRLPVYGTSGALIDKIKEARFDEKFRVKEIDGGNRTYLPKEIVSASVDTVIIKDCPLPRKRTAGTTRKTKKPTTSTVKLDSKVIMPALGAGDFNFLIGRKTDKTILDRQNEVIIKQNAEITPDTLRIARRNGKLLELALHSVK